MVCHDNCHGCADDIHNAGRFNRLHKSYGSTGRRYSDNCYSDHETGTLGEALTNQVVDFTLTPEGMDTSVTYNLDENTSKVRTYFKAETELKREGYKKDTIQCLLPHQYKKSEDPVREELSYVSARGTLKAIIGNTFETTDTFYGMVPQFTTTQDDSYSQELMTEYLEQMATYMPAKELLMNPDAYWQHVFVPVRSLCDADAALEDYWKVCNGEVKDSSGNIAAFDYNEQINAYWFAHNMRDLGTKPEQQSFV